MVDDDGENVLWWRRWIGLCEVRLKLVCYKCT